MIFAEPETPRFLAALQRLKQRQRQSERRKRLAQERLRAVLRMMRRP